MLSRIAPRIFYEKSSPRLVLSQLQQRAYAKSAPRKPTDYQPPRPRVSAASKGSVQNATPTATGSVSSAGARGSDNSSEAVQSEGRQDGRANTDDHGASGVHSEGLKPGQSELAPGYSRTLGDFIRTAEPTTGSSQTSTNPKTESNTASTESSSVSAEPSTGTPRPGSSSADYGTPDSVGDFQVPTESRSGPASHGPPQPDVDSTQTKEQGEQEPTFNLHDLTRGIPSTLDAELEQAEAARKGEKSSVAKVASGGRGDRQTPASDFTTSTERRRNRNMRYLFGAMGLGVVGTILYYGRDWESKEEELLHPNAPSGWSPGGVYNRIKSRASGTMDYYNEPAFPKLLPNPDPTWERPYTLVLSLEDMLVKQEWTREHGWRIAKRPGVDYFLRYLSQYYELVIFTSIPSMTADPIIRKLDPYRIVLWPLFREATRYKNGEYIKDLSFLNRNLAKTLLVDTNPAHASLQPENAIILPKWDGSPGNKDLVALIPFLEYIAGMELTDVRQVLASYEGKDISTEFAKREAQMRAKFNAQMAQSHSKHTKHSIGGLASMFGIKNEGMRPDGMMSISEGAEKGLMLHDQIRQRGQWAYEELEKQIRQNGEKWMKEMQAEEEKAKEEYMKGMKSGLTGWFGKKE